MGMDSAKIFRADVFKFLETCKETFDIIFAGPPYAMGNIEDLPEEIFSRQLLNIEGWFILEHTPRNNFQKHPFFKTERKYGTTLFSIFINRT